MEDDTDRDVRELVSGDTLNEREENGKRAAEFNLRIVTAVAGTGGYPSAVHVDIHRDATLIFNRTIFGPWLFVQLATGGYTVTASSVLRPQGIDMPAVSPRPPATVCWSEPVDPSLRSRAKP